MNHLLAMSALNRKLLRDLWHIKGQALAIAVVIASGVGMYVMSKGMLISLEDTRLAYYERYRFADIYAAVKRAPESLTTRVTGLNGVLAAHSRIRAGGLLDITGVSDPITAQFLSMPEDNAAAINQLLMLQGQRPDSQRSNEVVLLDSFAKAHGMSPGDVLYATLNGKRRHLRVSGIAMSPEFVYAIAPGELVPDASRFAAVWMHRKTLDHAFDLDGAFNELLILRNQGQSETGLINALDRLLKPYGAAGAYPRSEQISDRFLSNEIRELGVMGYLLPPIFLLVAAFLLNVVSSRLIDTEREQIGLLKAFGYSNAAVAGHYLKLSGLIAAGGIVLGIVMGRSLGQGMASLYTEYFKFPDLAFNAPSLIYFTAGGVTLVAASIGCAAAALKALRLQPAVAMQPPAPPDYQRTLAWLDGSFPKLDQGSRMILRHLVRWPRRAALTSTGIAMAMGLMIASNFSLDAIDQMIEVSFNVMERQDASVSFFEPQHSRALGGIKQLDGVLAAEGFRIVPATLSFAHVHRREIIQGQPAVASLSRLVDAQEQPVTLPQEGIVLSEKLAELLHIKVGETLHVDITEGHRPSLDLPVTQVVRTYMGTAAYMSLAALNRLMHEHASISGVNILVDPLKADAVYSQMKQIPQVAGVGIQARGQQAFKETLDESLGTIIFFNTLFGALIAIGVVYNSARIALSERGRELASLRVLGLTRAEVSYILLGELAVLTALALPLGAAFGYGLASMFTRSMDTELFRLPLLILPSTYGYAALVVVVAAILSGLLVRRRIDHLDLVAVLKTRE